MMPPSSTTTELGALASTTVDPADADWVTAPTEDAATTTETSAAAVAETSPTTETPAVVETPPTTTETTSVTVERTIRIMALGDSLTDGGDPNQPTTSPQSYRGYLSAGLIADGHDIDFVGSKSNPAIGGGDPDHEGHGGFTIGPDASTLCATCGSSNLSDNLDAWLAAATPDVILLMAGANDMLPEPLRQDGGFWRPVSPADAAPKLTALIAKLRAGTPESTILVASYPPISFLVDPALDRRTDFLALNQAARSAGDGRDPQVIYVPVFEGLDGDWGPIDVLSNGDELHPSANGASRIAAIWAESLSAVLDG